ncbi:hypothetical protein Tco_0204552 [Tanacetum coccineum]
MHVTISHQELGLLVRAVNIKRGFLSLGGKGRGVKEKEKKDMDVVNNRVKEATGSNEAAISGNVATTSTPNVEQVSGTVPVLANNITKGPILTENT